MDGAKTKVYEAARDGDYVALSALIPMSISERRTVLETKTQDGGHFATPLIMAAYNGHLDAIKILLKYKADIEGRGTVKIGNEMIEGCTPLWVAAATEHLDVVKLLIEQNAEVDGRTVRNSTPLRAATYNGHHDIVRCLVESRADVNARTDFDNTPLMAACYKGHEAVVSYLLAHGANIKLQNKNGHSALHAAVDGNNFEIVNDLLALGAPQLPNNERLTPLLLASNECKIEIVENLIKSPQCTIQQRIEALELLGGTIANDGDAYDTKKAFFYMKRGMEERFQDLSRPLLKQHMEPVEVYENRKESQTLEELALIKDHDHAIHMEGLIIRERILGTGNELLCLPLQFRGAAFADSRNFDRCFDLWKHALEIAVHCGSEDITDDLRSFCEVFCDMIHQKCPPRQKYIKEVLEKVIDEHERLTELLKSKNLTCDLKGKDEGKSLQEKLETLVHTSLYLISVFTKVQDVRKTEISGVVGLTQRLISLNPRTRNGNTLLHLSVWCETPTDVHHVRYVCKFPCVKTTKLIINAGGNVNAVNSDGNSPLHLAVGFQPKNNDDLQELRSVIRSLLDGGVNKDLVNRDGNKAGDVTATAEALSICTVK